MKKMKHLFSYYLIFDIEIRGAIPMKLFNIYYLIRRAKNEKI